METLLEFLAENKGTLLAGAAAVLAGSIWLARSIAAKTKSKKDDAAVDRVATKLALLAEVLSRLSAEYREKDLKQEEGKVRENLKDTGHM